MESLIFCCSSFLSENIICDLTVKTKNENTYTFRAVVINRGERKAVVCSGTFLCGYVDFPSLPLVRFGLKRIVIPHTMT